MRAGRRPSARFGHAQRGAVRLGRVGGGEDQVLVLALRQAAQALDRSGERELGAAEALDEVAAPRGAEHLQVRELAVEAREAAGHALGEHRLAGDDPVALQHQLGLRAQARPLGGRVAEQRLGQRPAADDRLLGGVAARGEPPRGPALAADGGQAAGAQRREGVVGDLAGPGEVPERRVQLLALDVELRHQVEPERGRGAEPLADRVVDLALGTLELRVRRRRAGEVDVLAEVERDAAGRAPSAPGADPDDLAAGGQLVEPGRAVGAEPARQHVALPDLRGQRHALQRDQRLAQAIGAGAGGPVRVDVLPGGQEAGELGRIDRLGLLAQRGDARAAHPAQDVGVAPLALGSAREELAADELAGALELLAARASGRARSGG